MDEELLSAYLLPYVSNGGEPLSFEEMLYNDLLRKGYTIPGNGPYTKTPGALIPPQKEEPRSINLVDMMNQYPISDVTSKPKPKYNITGKDILKTTEGAIRATQGVITGDNHHMVGDIMTSLAPVAGLVPGIGTALSAGLTAAGTLVNAAFGSNVNDAAIADIRERQNKAKSITADTSSTDALAKQFSSLPSLGSVKVSDIGSEGFFSNSVTKKARKLSAGNAIAVNTAFSNLNAGVNNLKQSNMLSYMKNKSAYGGPVGDAIGYNFMQQSLLNEQQKINNYNNKITSLPNSFMYQLAEGGHTHGGVFTNGLTYVGEGGTHEQNPNEGVLIGFDNQGIPNLVEEGEYIWNDYVFSNRTKVPKEVHNAFGLGGKKDGYTFAEAVDFIQRESEERPNDPISDNYLQKSLQKLMQIQEEIRQKQMAQQNMQQRANIFSGGGKFDDDKIYDFSDTSIYGTKDSNGKYAHGADWKAIAKLIDDHPEYVVELFKYGKALLNNKDANKDTKQYKFFQDLFNKKAFKQYKTKDLTTDIVGGWKTKYNDGFPGIYYNIARAAAGAYGHSTTAENMMLNFMTKDANGNYIPVNIDGAPAVYAGTKDGLLKWLNYAKDLTSKTRKELLEEQGYVIPDNLSASRVGDGYVFSDGTVYDEKQASDKKDKTKYAQHRVILNTKDPQKTKKKAKTNYLEVGTGKTFDPNLIYTDPKYKNWTILGKTADPNTGDENWYYGPEQQADPNPLSNLRFSAIPYNLGNVIADAAGVNNPDYQLAKNLENLNLTAPNIGVPRSSTRLQYTPTDPNAVSTQLRDTFLATKSALQQSSPSLPSLGAQLIGLNYQDAIARGKAYNEAVKNNSAQYNATMEKNAVLESQDFDRALKAAQANQANAMQANQLALDKMYKGAVLRQAEETAAQEAINANTNAFINDLTDIGREYTQRNWINTNNAFNYGMGDLGEITLKEFFNNPELLQQAIDNKKKKKLGGYLTIK